MGLGERVPQRTREPVKFEHRAASCPLFLLLLKKQREREKERVLFALWLYLLNALVKRNRHVLERVHGGPA